LSAGERLHFLLVTSHVIRPSNVATYISPNYIRRSTKKTFLDYHYYKDIA